MALVDILREQSKWRRFIEAQVGGGGGTPGGADGQVQFNNLGAFGGFGNWDGTSFELDTLEKISINSQAADVVSLVAGTGSVHIGNDLGIHIAFDRNNIQPKQNGTTVGTLNIANLGGTVQFGASTALTGFQVSVPDALFTGDISIGTTGATFPMLGRFVDTGGIELSSSSSTATGANIILTGGSNANAGDVQIRNDGVDWLFYDASVDDVFITPSVVEFAENARLNLGNGNERIQWANAGNGSIDIYQDSQPTITISGTNDITMQWGNLRVGSNVATNGILSLDCSVSTSTLIEFDRAGIKQGEIRNNISTGDIEIRGQVAGVEIAVYTDTGGEAIRWDTSQDTLLQGYIAAYAGTPADEEVLTWVAANGRAEFAPVTVPASSRNSPFGIIGNTFGASNISVLELRESNDTGVQMRVGQNINGNNTSDVLNLTTNGSVRIGTSNASASNAVSFLAGNTQIMQSFATEMRLESAIDLTFIEKADHAAIVSAAKGMLWVRNDTPNVLVFTDDAGTDTVLGGGGGGSNVTNLGETTMSGGTFDDSGWPDDVEWFTIHFWDVNMSSAANDITLRLRSNSGLVTTGYDSQTRHVDSAGTVTANNDTAHFEVPNFDGLGIVRGYFKGTRTSSVTDRWAVEGMFIDDDSDEIVHLHGHVDLVSDLDGYRIQSANAAAFTAGMFSVQYGT